MSDHAKEESQNPISSLLGVIFVCLVPFALVVMLGYVGAAFIGGSGHKGEAAPAEVQAQASMASAAPAGNAAATKSDAPADPKTTAEPETVASAAKDTPPAPPAAEAGAAPSEEQMALGKANFMLCAACHGPDGKGMAAGPMKMAPGLSDSKILTGHPEASTVAVLKGIKKETADYMQQMIPQAMLDDQKLAAVLTYARNSFGNSAPAISPEDVAEIRAKYADVPAEGGMSRKELEKLATQ